MTKFGEKLEFLFSEKAAEELKTCNREKVGRPRIEVDQPGLLETILDLVQASSATDDRRRSEIVRTVKTLKDLNTELIAEGYNLSENATFIRLQARREGTKSAERHIQTVPVRLIRPENTLRKKNEDRMFAKSFTGNKV